MLLSPRYGPKPVIYLDGDPTAIAAPAIRQRQRLLAAAEKFTAEQWAHPSRCAGWSTRDVILHLDGTNTFWSLTISSGMQGNPTRFLATFDPVASPPQMVAAAGDLTPEQVLDRFRATTEALASLWASLDPDAWSMAAEAPPGHVSISAVTHHALWDSWVHERDILLPLGITPACEPDEIAACLRYGAALGPALDRNRGDERTGTMAIAVDDPEVAFTVAIGADVHVRIAGAPTDDTSAPDVQLTGDAVELLEAMSIRTAWRQPVPAEHAWMLRGLSTTFDDPADDS